MVKTFVVLIVGLAVSSKHTYMFSAGDDKQVKCWDLEQNKVRTLLSNPSVQFSIVLATLVLKDILIALQVIRSYHGHLSGVYCLALHPTIDVLLTGGRDSVCRVWKFSVHIKYFLQYHNRCAIFASQQSKFFISDVIRFDATMFRSGIFVASSKYMLYLGMTTLFAQCLLDLRYVDPFSALYYLS